MDVADWFSAFCAVYEEFLGAEEQQAQPKATAKRRGRPSKKVLQRVSFSDIRATTTITNNINNKDDDC